ncbi:uncharacterized protein OCT59_020136 [Rhizophagus irregularis]|uniref:uncharacterized protein n=1 Tax=Rhizophagus irregularis TaxID=588596 RepID=UPI003328DD98|nr:hypothetical protein OCT59_020136 [Rhizophagus irregularis]
MNTITDDDRKMILEKVKQPPTASTPLDTTFITGFKQLAYNINTAIALQLPSLEPNRSPIVSNAIDYYNDELKSINETDKMDL